MLTIKSTRPVLLWQRPSKMQISKSRSPNNQMANSILKILKATKLGYLDGEQWACLWPQRTWRPDTSLQCFRDYVGAPALTACGGKRRQGQLSSRLGRTAPDGLHWFCPQSRRGCFRFECPGMSSTLAGRKLDRGLFQMLTITQVDNGQCEINIM